jgi:hypothetical protein
MILTRPLLGDRSQAGINLAQEITHELEHLDIKPGQAFFLLPHVEDQSKQLTLSDPDKKHLGPFAWESETSRRAAIDAYPRQGSHRWKILKALVVSSLTRYEITQRTGLLENSVRPRVIELIEGGWIEETDLTRPTNSKSKAVVLSLTAKARRDDRLMIADHNY